MLGCYFNEFFFIANFNKQINLNTIAIVINSQVD